MIIWNSTPKIFFLFLITIVFLSACQENIVDSTASPTSAVASTRAQLSATASSTTQDSYPISTFTATPIPYVVPTDPPAIKTLTPTPSQTSTPTRTATPSVTPSPIPLVNAPPGLIYSGEDGLWRVKADGLSERISDISDAVLSSTQPKLLYAQDGDIFVADLGTGEKRNVTQTSNRTECCPTWWLGQRDTIVFGSWPENYEPFHGPFGDFEFGFLTRAKIDGNQYEVLDETAPFHNWLAPAPYSTLLIYGNKIYDDTSGIRPFSAVDFLVIPPSTVKVRERVYGPAWTQDGTLLAGYVHRRLETYSNLNEGIAVFDFNDNTLQYIHDYQVYGTDTPPPMPVWSPDNSMIAFYARDHDDNNRGLWIIAVKSGEILFSPAQNMQLECYNEIVWSPPSGQVACAVESRHDKAFLLIDLKDGSVMRLELPEGTTLLDWR